MFKGPVAGALLIAAGLCVQGCARSGPTSDPTPAPLLLETTPETAPDPGVSTEPVLIAPAAETEEKPRFFGFLRRDKPDPDAVTPAPIALAETTSTDVIPTAPTTDPLPAIDPVLPPEPSMSDPEIAEAGAVAAGTPNPSRRPRLFGFLNKRVPGEVEVPAPEPISETPSDSVLIAAALPAAEETVTDAAPETFEPVAPRRAGLLGGLFGGRNAPDLETTTSGATEIALPSSGPLPFGTVVKACGVNRRALGNEVARHAATGFRLYDTDATSIQPRTQYLVGFRDGCPRQFTAALALFGSTDVHETTRYNPSNSNPYSDTDRAYERVKNRICGVGRGEYCPANKTKKLNRDATFVSVYRGFGSSGEWVEIFLHKGQMVAYQTRTR